MGLPEMITPAEAVGHRIDELKGKYGVSLHRIALRSGVPYSTVKSYGQDNTRDITLGTLISLANFFGMTLSEFTDSDYFDRIDVSLLKKREDIDMEEGLQDFRELHNKSEEWTRWNNSKWWCREDI